MTENVTTQQKPPSDFSYPCHREPRRPVGQRVLDTVIASNAAESDLALHALRLETDLDAARLVISVAMDYAREQNATIDALREQNARLREEIRGARPRQHQRAA